MMKKLILALSLIVLPLVSFAQNYSGGVEGKIVNRSENIPVSNAKLTLYKGAEQLAVAKSDSKGNFLIKNLEDGVYTLLIDAPDYLPERVNVTVHKGYVKNMVKLTLTSAQKVAESSDESLLDFDSDAAGFNDNPVPLFGANDIFSNVANFNFSAVRFRNRGYASESQDVYLAGVRLNDAITGYSPYSLWSGLNEATRSKDGVIGNEMSDYGFSRYNGLTNIFADASSMRTGFRMSTTTVSQFYRLRLMASYASGQLDNGWSYAFNFSARLGGNDWVKGVFYRSFAYYAALDKVFDDTHKLGFIFFAAPGQRGAQNGSTQEVYDLMKDNMYNSNWGYQNGVIRNARVRKTHEPVFVMKYDFTPSDKFRASATVLYRFGKNGYTALDWYDAPDPRPDYYRNLPSYFYSENPDLNRKDLFKYNWAKDAWTRDVPHITHINWDRFYQINKMNKTASGARSKYVVEERRADQQDFNFAATAKYTPSRYFSLNGGISARINRTEHYKVLEDLLGGDYYENVDQFAERDFSSSKAKVQNDLDYYLSNGASQRLNPGDKYGYDYYARVNNFDFWLNSAFSKGNFSGSLAAKVGYNSFWRDGLVRKGLFAGVDKDGNDIIVNGENLTVRDSYGEVVSSFGKSKVNRFFTYGLKANLSYLIGGNMRVYGNFGFYNDAPLFNHSFISPRTRNSVIRGLKPVKTFSGDLNYQFISDGYNLRATAFYTQIMDQTKVMSYYNDLEHAFSNFSMTGIDSRYAGIELGFRIPTPISNLSLQGVLSYGEYVYTSNPKMTLTVDNSSSTLIDNETVPYWKSTPVFKRDSDGNYLKDGSGNFTMEEKGKKKHYVPATPQFAANLGLAWNKNYWFVNADVDFFANSYLDMNPFYRTDLATAGPDGIVTPGEIEYMTAQEKLNNACLVNLSVGKSWFIRYKYQLGFSFQLKNLLNNKNVKTGGYEYTRLVDKTDALERSYRFDSKYFYMSGINYMLTVYFKF